MKAFLPMNGIFTPISALYLSDFDHPRLDAHEGLVF